MEHVSQHQRSSVVTHVTPPRGLWFASKLDPSIDCVPNLWYIVCNDQKLSVRTLFCSPSLEHTEVNLVEWVRSVIAVSLPEHLPVVNQGTPAWVDLSFRNTAVKRWDGANLPGVEQIKRIDGPLDLLHQLDSTEPQLLIKIFPLSNTHAVFTSARPPKRNGTFHHPLDELLRSH